MQMGKQPDGTQNQMGGVAWGVNLRDGMMPKQNPFNVFDKRVSRISKCRIKSHLYLINTNKNTTTY
jgi:hypothetical protein